MTHRTVAVNAQKHVSALLRRQHFMHKIPMTFQAGLLRDGSIAGLDANRIRIMASREGQRMKKTVIRFRHPFPNRMRAEMTIVAGRHRMVTRILPAIQVILHHMAIRTGHRVVAQIAHPFPVTKGKHPESRPESRQTRRAHVDQPPQLPPKALARTSSAHQCSRFFHPFHRPAPQNSQPAFSKTQSAACP